MEFEGELRDVRELPGVLTEADLAAHAVLDAADGGQRAADLLAGDVEGGADLADVAAIGPARDARLPTAIADG